MTWNPRKVIGVCEVCCHGGSGDFIEYEHLTEDNAIDFYRCNIHYPQDDIDDEVLPEGWRRI